MNKEKIIIVGNDHANSIGLIHCLGAMGLYVIVVMWGRKTGLVKSSKYVRELNTAADAKACMQLIAEKYGQLKETIVLFAGCDDAAVAMEECRGLLPKNIVFQQTRGIYSLKDLDNKNLQVSIAAKSGFNVPKSWEIESKDIIPSDVVFPCIVKALVAREGSKADLLVCDNEESLKTNIELVLSRNHKVQLQQYINKDFDYDMMGCRFQNGEIVTVCLKKLGIYPPKVGLATVSETIITPVEILYAAKKYLEEINYYGIFDFEFMHSTDDDKNYFIECNLRNSGSNEFAFKAGINIPYAHYLDMIGEDYKRALGDYHQGQHYIREMQYFKALLKHTIPLKEVIKDLRKSDGCLTYDKRDRLPFYKQFIDLFLQILHLKKNVFYE